MEINNHTRISNNELNIENGMNLGLKIEKSISEIIEIKQEQKELSKSNILSKYKDIQNDVNILNTQVSNYKERLNKNKDQLLFKKKENEILKNEFDKVKQEKEKSNTVIKQLKKQIEEIKPEIQQSKQLVIQLINNIKEMKNQIDQARMHDNS